MLSMMLKVVHFQVIMIWNQQLLTETNFGTIILSSVLISKPLNQVSEKHGLLIGKRKQAIMDQVKIFSISDKDPFINSKFYNHQQLIYLLKIRLNKIRLYLWQEYKAWVKIKVYFNNHKMFLVETRINQMVLLHLCRDHQACNEDNLHYFNKVSKMIIASSAAQANVLAKFHMILTLRKKE